MAENESAGILDSVGRVFQVVKTPQSPTEGESEVPFLEHRPSDSSHKKPWTGLLVMTAISACLCSVFPAGYHIGVLNGPQQIIMEFCNTSIAQVYGSGLDRWPLDLLWSFVVSIFLIGGGIGAFVGGSIANKIGRKNAMLVNGVLNIVGAILFGTCTLVPSVEMLLIGRFIVGLAGGLGTSVMPLYMSEISTDESRNILGILCPIGITLGLFIGEILSLEVVLGNEDNWNILLAVSCVPVLIALAMWLFTPESPRYLFVLKGNSDAAIKELCRLRNTKANESFGEIASMQQESLERAKRSENSGQDADEWTFNKIWKTPTLRPLFICVVVLHLGNQLSGINAVFYYSTGIFESAGLDKQQAEYALLASGLVNFLMCCSTMYLTERFPRRPLMLISTGGALAFLVVLTITISNIEKATWIAYFSIGALIVYVIFFEVGVGPIPFYLPTELIPPGPRPLIMSIGCMINWMTNFLVGMTFPSLQAFMGVYSFLIFAAFMALQMLFIYFKLPETFRSVSVDSGH